MRIGVHTGTPFLAEEGYVGGDVNRAARIAACGHGGQVLVSASTASLVRSDGLRDLGEHRLKDLSAPERIFQLNHGDFPPLNSLHQTNLPIPATPFLARERELQEVSALLRREAIRLLTLTGPGGTGKTRLALQAAGAAADAFPAGAWWVPLAPLRDPRLVLDAVAHALAAPGDVAEHIGEKRLLLLLDNFEHVADAASDVAPLLQRCPRLTLLVTSREPLHLDGESEYAVEPLREDEAVALFETRARAVRRDFAVDGEVREICARLDNLPLAIELAAARVKVLSPKALLGRLERRLPVLAGGTRDAPGRQRTLRATIEWSHDLLSAEERILFRRLGVFRGGCTLETAEEVADADLDTLASLVDKSLVRQNEDRFWMLETIREYARDSLDASGEADELAARHAAAFLALAETAEPHLRGAPKEWLDRLTDEHDNFRASLDRLGDAPVDDCSLRLAGALWKFWYMRGHLREGRRRLEAALRTNGDPTVARGRALNGAAVIAIETGDAGIAKQWATEALALHQTLGDAHAAAYSRLMVGQATAEEGDLATAQQLFADCTEDFLALGDDHLAVIARHNLAWMYRCLGDHARGRMLHEENLRLAREWGSDRLIATSLCSLAGVAVEAGRPLEAVSLLAETHRLNRGVGDASTTAYTLEYFAAALAAAGRAEAGARVFAASEAFREETGARVRPTDSKVNERTLAAIRAQLDERSLADAWAAGRAMNVEQAVELAVDAAR